MLLLQTHRIMQAASTNIWWRRMDCSLELSGMLWWDAITVHRDENNSLELGHRNWQEVSGCRGSSCAEVSNHRRIVTILLHATNVQTLCFLLVSLRRKYSFVKLISTVTCGSKLTLHWIWLDEALEQRKKHSTEKLCWSIHKKNEIHILQSFQKPKLSIFKHW